MRYVKISSGSWPVLMQHASRRLHLRHRRATRSAPKLQRTELQTETSIHYAVRRQRRSEDLRGGARRRRPAPVNNGIGLHDGYVKPRNSGKQEPSWAIWHPVRGAMFIVARSQRNAPRRGAMCQRTPVNKLEASDDIAPRWGALRQTKLIYKHSTPSGVGHLGTSAHRSVRLRPSAAGSFTPRSVASVGAISLISIWPRSRPAAIPGPAMKNDEFISATSGA